MFNLDPCMEANLVTVSSNRVDNRGAYAEAAVSSWISARRLILAAKRRASTTRERMLSNGQTRRHSGRTGTRYRTDISSDLCALRNFQSTKYVEFVSIRARARARLHTWAILMRPNQCINERLPATSPPRDDVGRCIANERWDWSRQQHREA